MNWRITALSIAAILLLLVILSATNTVFGYTAEYLKITIPTAQVAGVALYGDIYEDRVAFCMEIPGSISSQNVVIERTMVVPTLNLRATISISMASVTMSGARIFAWNLTSTSGTLSGVAVEVKPPPTGIRMTITSGTMHNVVAFAWKIDVTQLQYEGLVARVLLG
jgi:hypothetical protein